MADNWLNLTKELLITLKDINSTNTALIALTKNEVYEAGIETLLAKINEVELSSTTSINEQFLRGLY